MSDQRRPKIWIDHYDLNVGVEGGPEETLDEVREHFDELLDDAVERDPKLGEDDVTPRTGVE